MADLLPHHRRAALALNAAFLNHRTAHLNPEEMDAMGLAEARTILADNATRWEQRGHTRLGWAANMMNSSRREAHGLSEPIVGAMLEDQVLDDGQRVDLARFNDPLIGAALAVRLNMDPPAQGCNTADIRRCASALLAAIVIYDTRITDSTSGIAQQADNGGFGAAVIAQRGKAFTKVDAKSVVATLTHDRTDVGSGSGMSLMGDPVEAGAWITNTVGTMGKALHEGDLILLGSCTKVVPLTEGHWKAAIPMLGEISLTVTRNT